MLYPFFLLLDTSNSHLFNQAYIEAAEVMLEDDVTSNKAIGSYGASFIKNYLTDSKNITILTHCNTGRYTPVLVFYFICMVDWFLSYLAWHGFLPYPIILPEIAKYNSVTGLTRTIVIRIRYPDGVILIFLAFLNSLATAGYGTALGVIRALYADGALERAYCTETRPFNQVVQRYSLFFF